MDANANPLPTDCKKSPRAWLNDISVPLLHPSSSWTKAEIIAHKTMMGSPAKVDQNRVCAQFGNNALCNAYVVWMPSPSVSMYGAACCSNAGF
eukprot:1991996-Amphidinium_carterae.2